MRIINMRINQSELNEKWLQETKHNFLVSKGFKLMKFTKRSKYRYDTYTKEIKIFGKKGIIEIDKYRIYVIIAGDEISAKNLTPNNFAMTMTYLKNISVTWGGIK